jgi:alpha-galactosidase
MKREFAVWILQDGGKIEMKDSADALIITFKGHARSTLLDRTFSLAAIIISCSISLRSAAQPTPEEMATANQWRAAHFDSNISALPFSFNYNGQPSATLLGHWQSNRDAQELSNQRTQYTLTFTEPKTGLVVRCVAVQYQDFPTLEWTLYFENISSVATPVVEDIRALNTQFERGKDDEFVLHYSKGSPSPATATDYEPLQATLLQNSEMCFAPVGGRPTEGDLPYFNVKWKHEGVIVVVGWPGQWVAHFTRNQGRCLRIQAGQQLTHFKLLPGEQVRTPLIVLQLWRGGDWIRAQNIWRRWMLAHNVPRIWGKLPSPMLAGGTCPYYGPFIHNDQQNQELFIRRYQEEGIRLDAWWLDAGWYPNDGTWTNTGTWELDKARFPHGLCAVADYAHSRGEKFIVWFEPERVTPGTWLYERQPGWLLRPPPSDAGTYKRGWRLLNVGEPQAWNWLLNHISKFINAQGIDIYHQDFNIAPLPFWQSRDAEDRQGKTENHYITSLLKYWDELRLWHPDIMIDTCASGGRRNDLETLRRAVPLWRSDYIIKPTGMQNQTYGISLWIPYYGGASQVFEISNENGKKTIDAYAFRSDMYPSIHAHWDVRQTDLDYKRLRELVRQWREISPDYFGDYYPLSPYSTSDKVWIAWQFDRPQVGTGMVQVFRRPQSTKEKETLKLRGLDQNSRYSVTKVDTCTKRVLTGRELMKKGLPVELGNHPDSAIFMYRLLGPSDRN